MPLSISLCRIGDGGRAALRRRLATLLSCEGLAVVGRVGKRLLY
jgi:hypothetical protein